MTRRARVQARLVGGAVRRDTGAWLAVVGWGVRACACAGLGILIFTYACIVLSCAGVYGGGHAGGCVRSARDSATLHTNMTGFLRLMRANVDAWPFEVPMETIVQEVCRDALPVRRALWQNTFPIQAPDYLEVVKEPISAPAPVARAGMCASCLCVRACARRFWGN